MICQVCQKNPATVHITELPLAADSGTPAGDTSADSAADGAESSADSGADGSSGPSIVDKHICPTCAQQLNLPHMQVVSKNNMDIWKLLQLSSQQSREDSKLACPDCGMTLGEFRTKGRLGCPNDYEIFRDHLDALLMRMHNANEHEGRLPGTDEDALQRKREISTLRERLEVAIREEAYEAAAALRDELKILQDG